MDQFPEIPASERVERLEIVRSRIAAGIYRPPARRVATAILVRAGAIALERDISADDRGREPVALDRRAV